MTKESCGRVGLCCLVLCTLTCAAQSQVAGKKCTEPAKFYEDHGYTVREVRIDSPLGWLFGSVEQTLSEIIHDPSMPVKKGQPFRKQDEDEGFIRVKEKFPELTVSKSDRFAFRLARPTLENCDASAAKLDVVYRVFTFGFSNFTNPLFPGGIRDDVKRSVVDTKATQALANYFPQPLAGFNRSRNPYAGTRLTINQPAGLLEKLSLEAFASNKSDEERVRAAGSRERPSGLLRRFDYIFAYYHSKVPAPFTDLKEAVGLGQVIATTKPIGTRPLVLRFGSALETGYKQSTLGSLQLQPGDVAQSPYGALKVFLGSTVRSGRHEFKASYGIQLGSATKDAHLDFVKHLVDASANLRFLPKDHRPITVQAEFAAGSIQNRGRLPVAERFFGGNVEHNFIASSDWIIRSDPYIRSFPENTLAQTTPQAFVGGDRFLSANLTAAFTVWGRPLVPDEVLKEPDFEKLVDFEFNTARNALAISYLEESPEFRKVAEMSFPLAEQLADIRKHLSNLTAKHLGDEIDTQLQICQSDVEDLNETLSQIKNDLTEGSAKSADLRMLAVGFPTKSPPIPAEVSDLLDDLNDLKDTEGLPDPQAIADLITQTESLRAAMAKAFVEVSDPATSTAAAKANNEAREIMVYPRRVFRELSHEANLLAVSAVLIFDAARLRQNRLTPSTMRYAVGGGVRFSIVSLDITTAYAFNPGRKPWERRGALVFEMEVSNLFR
jgi:hypothetical protein